MENVGLSVYEGVSEGATAFRTPAKRNIGLILEAERGVPNIPQRLISQAAALRIFGNSNPNMYGALVLADLFANSDPFSPTVYGSRIVGALSVPATKTQAVFGTSATVSAAYLGRPDPGIWGNSLVVEFNNPGGISPKLYTATVKYKSKAVEQFQGATFAVLQTTINQQSEFVAVTFAGEPILQEVVSTPVVTLAGGVYAAPTEADYTPVPSAVSPKGLSVFDGYNIQLLTLTELSSSSSAKLLSDYCTRRLDVHGIAVLPFRATGAVAQEFATLLQTSGRSRISVYDHWRRVNSTYGTSWIPGMGFVLGAGFIRTAALQGDYIHIPPAGVDSVSIGAVECAPARRGQTELNFYTRELTINSVVFTEGTGYYIATSRTMSTNTLHESIHLGLQASYYVRAIENNLLFAVQKPNTPELGRQGYVALRNFFKGEYAVGALERSIPLAKAAIITTLTPSPGARKTREWTIDYIPTETTESVRINVNRNDGALSAATEDK